MKEVKRLISVVLSFRNEQDVIPELVARLQKVLCAMPYDYELIFVNDASTDDSLALLLNLRKQDPNIKIINTSRRFGVTPGVLAGFNNATGDAVIYMDADLQDPPELIPELVRKWEQGADIVHTTRVARHGENALKMWLTRMAYRFINAVADIRILENTGDFKLISRRALNEILKLKEFDPFMRGLVAWVGFRQEQVFYERAPRFAGKSKFSLWRSLNPYREFLRGITMFSSLPLYFALFFGLAVSFAAFCFFVFMFFRLLLAHAFNAGWALLMISILFLCGMILFTVGILGIYVGKIHRDIKGRPNYIISEKIGFGPDDAAASIKQQEP